MLFPSPAAESVILHRCPVSGLALCQMVNPDGPAICEMCGWPVLPDQPARAGHAWIFCPLCGVSVGVCGRAAFERLEAEAALILGA